MAYKARKKPARGNAPGLKGITSIELRHARLEGFTKKKPKKPARSTVESLTSYLANVDAWKREVKAAAKRYKLLQDLKRRAKNV
jgi:hypothetical protein